MARLVARRIPSQVAWSASGSINQELAPIPFTVTAMAIIVHASVTTTTATNFSDYWDRIITSLNLTGNIEDGSQTFLDLSDLRLPYHHSRMVLGQFAPLRPTVVADSVTAGLQQFMYLFPFSPNAVHDGRLDLMDVNGGIPAISRGNLSLGGQFAAAGAMGTNVTINDADLDIYMIGVQAEPGDDPRLWIPRAFPMWSMRTPTPSATSTVYATADDIPAGALLRNMTIMQTNGANAPRDDEVLNSIRLYLQSEGREVLSFGGRAGASDASGGDYKAAELISQLYKGAAPRSENKGTPGVPSMSAVSDVGIVHFPLNRLGSRVHPYFGADLRNIGTGDLQLQWGVSDATGVAVKVLYERYELNVKHPDFKHMNTRGHFLHEGAAHNLIFTENA